jgi:cytochrome c
MDAQSARSVIRLFILIIFFFMAVHSGAMYGQEVIQRKDAQGPVHRDDLARKEKKAFAAALALGEKLWYDRSLGTNGMSCNHCHPDAAATHPETFPKFKSQMGGVVSAQQFINWCVVIPLQGKAFELGGKELNALEAYMVSQNRGQTLSPGEPSP